VTNPLSAQGRNPSRRAILLRSVGYAAGASALFGAGREANAAKMAQPAAAYQNSPKNGVQCDGCALFEAPNGCKLVDGDISPAGWCKFWAKKSG